MIEPDTVSNERPFSGRLYVVVLDDLNVAFLRSKLVKNAAKQFIERNLSANDLMAIVSTGGLSDWSQEFTNNTRLLQNTIDRFAGQKLPSSVLARNERRRTAAEGTQSGFTMDATSGGDWSAPQRLTMATNYLNSIKSVADWFGGIRGRRKTMLLFSEGLDLGNDLTNLMSSDLLSSFGAGAIMRDTQGSIAAATRGNVSIYTIDPRGLTTMGDDDITVSGFVNRGDLGQAGLFNERIREQLSLRTFAEETGGLPSSTRINSPTPSIASSTRTAPTICWRTIRRRTRETASSTRST